LYWFLQAKREQRKSHGNKGRKRKKRLLNSAVVRKEKERGTSGERKFLQEWGNPDKGT